MDNPALTSYNIMSTSTSLTRTSAAGLSPQTNRPRAETFCFRPINPPWVWLLNRMQKTKITKVKMQPSRLLTGNGRAPLCDLFDDGYMLSNINLTDSNGLYKYR
uniref:Uncharacterized protein n=1 Tax=Romanomermis culicivorax TaxID=13658 RepID=A0A915HV29_ROMCU